MANKEEILDYVMNSPQNTNQAVLGNMLDNLEGGGSGGMVANLRYIVEIGEPMRLECDKTVNEIAEAMKNGTNVMVHFTDEEYWDEYWLNTAFDEYANNVVCYYIDTDGTMYKKVYGTRSNNTWSV